MAKKSPHVVSIDYSLNEPTGNPELFEIEDGKSIRIYSFHDLVGEKFRALLQQEKRNLSRPQDIYDLHFLLKDHPLRDGPLMRREILRSLKEKAAARNLAVEKESMRNPEIIHRSELNFQHIESQIEGELPSFDDAYAAIRAYYEGLPWDT